LPLSLFMANPSTKEDFRMDLPRRRDIDRSHTDCILMPATAGAGAAGFAAA
jgi:hypothetical protein